MYNKGWIPVLFSECVISEMQVLSVQFSRSVVTDSLRPVEPQHARHYSLWQILHY